MFFPLIVLVSLHNHQIEIIRMSDTLATAIHNIVKAFRYICEDVSLFVIG
jgi:hypothetical protein